MPVDAVGLFLLAVGVGCLQFMLDNGNDDDWFTSKTITVLAIVSLVCLTFLVAWELMHKNPVVELRLLGKRNFLVGVLCLSLGMFAFFGGTVVMPMWVQEVLGYTATWAGFVVAPIGVLAIVMSPLVGAFQNKFDLRLLNTVGFAIFAGASFYMSTLSTNAPYSELALPRMCMGAGVALFFVPVNQIILSGLPDERVASASGLSNFFRTLAGSIATAVSTTMYSHRTTYHHAVLAENVSEGSRTTTEYLDRFQAFGVQGPTANAALNRIVDMQAATLAVNDVFWVFGLMFGLAMIAIWFAKPPFASGGTPGH
jgi:DHA2 family multidrug resistance protein